MLATDVSAARTAPRSRAAAAADLLSGAHDDLGELLRPNSALS
jgi:hypothetical protein